MARLHASILICLAAVAVQPSFGGKSLELTLPGLFGSSFSVKTLGQSKSVGGSITFEEDGFKVPVLMGPAGGIQARIVTPVLPKIGDIIKKAELNLGGLGNWFKPKTDFGENFFKSINNNFQNFLALFGLKRKEIVTDAGGLLEAAVKRSKISRETASDVAYSIVQSAVENTRNNMAALIDMLEKSVELKLIVEEQALQMLVDAIHQGVHKVDGGTKWTLERFVDAAEKARTITHDVADGMRALIGHERHHHKSKDNSGSSSSESSEDKNSGEKKSNELKLGIKIDMD